MLDHLAPRSPGRRLSGRRRWLGAVVLLPGLLFAACSSPRSDATNPPLAHAVSATTTTGAAPAPTSSGVSSSTTTTTKPASIPACGSTRDPYDPTLTPPPPGSPAICP